MEVIGHTPFWTKTRDTHFPAKQYLYKLSRNIANCYMAMIIGYANTKKQAFLTTVLLETEELGEKRTRKRVEPPLI